MSVRPRKISDIKPLFTNLAQTSHYEVQFNAFPPDGALQRFLQKKGVDTRFVSESAGLLCYSASLPTTTLGSFTVDGNYMGIQEKFANSRIYDEISLEFYVDKNYKMLLFLESWMEFIASGSFNVLDGDKPSINQNDDGYFVRMQYPTHYKLDSVKIIKFDRDYNREIEYNFRGLFPKNMNSLPISYVNSDVLKVSASFQYDRYIAGKTNSFDRLISGDSNNQDPTVQQSAELSQLSDEEILQRKKKSEQFSFDISSLYSKTDPRPKSNPQTPNNVIGVRFL